MNKKALRYSKKDIRSVSGRKLSHEEIQDRLFEMMCSFDSFCKKNDIEYYLTYGTLIGAVRHGGFIPWDDDVDIFVPRADYERLKFMDCVDENIDIVSAWDDHGYYHPYTYINLADKRTVIDEAFAAHPTGKGLFIDIFPLDEIPDRGVRRFVFMSRILFLRAIHMFTTKSFKKELSLKAVLMDIFIILFKPIDEVEMAKRIDTLSAKYCGENCRTLGLTLQADLRENSWPSEDYDHSVVVKYNGKDFPAPCEYDHVLRVGYGDYMTPPPPECRNGTHGFEAYERKEQKG